MAINKIKQQAKETSAGGSYQSQILPVKIGGGRKEDFERRDCVALFPLTYKKATIK